jgi:AAA15 family ATPase/GTPase
MLIRFSVENYRSFRDRAELSMVVGQAPQAHPEHVIESADPAVPQLLKTAILYGANASGKSNLVQAIATARKIILEPADVHGKLPIVPFKLDAHSAGKPSRFEFEIRIGERSFAYGFVATKEQVEEEWLFEIGAEEARIFERNRGGTKIDHIPFASGEERQFLEFTAKGTRSNRLFLAECRERNVQPNVPSAAALFDVLHWFERVLTVIFPDYTSAALEIAISRDSAFNDKLGGVLRSFDTGIQAVELQQGKIEDVHIPEKERAELEERVLVGESALIASTSKQRWLVDRDEQGHLRARKLAFKHSDKVGTPMFDLAEESDGTVRLMELIPAFFRSEESGCLVVIDEFDRSLHPQIAQSLLINFLRHSLRESQLIVTTHETTLLDLVFLRRDEIWLVEKGKDQSTRLIGLEEYKGVPQNGDLQRDYLHGRYGGVPVLRDFTKAGDRHAEGTERV